MCFEEESVTCGAYVKESVSVHATKTKSSYLCHRSSSSPTSRHVDLYKRRPPENDSHCDLIKQTLACFVE